MYSSVKYKERYCRNYFMFSERIHSAMVFFCLLVSMSSIATLAIWNYWPWLWALVAISAQACQLLMIHLPLFKPIAGLKFILPQLDLLLLEIDSHWRKMSITSDDYDEKKIGALVDKFDKRLNDLDSQFFGGTSLPKIDYCKKKAEEELKSYFNIYHGIGG